MKDPLAYASLGLGLQVHATIVHLKKKKKTTFQNVYFICVGILSADHICDCQKRVSKPLCWSYRWQRDIMWVLGTEPVSLQEQQGALKSLSCMGPRGLN